METIYAALLGFAFGSIPFGLLLTRAAGLGDVRKIGSGSIGATNVLRTGNKSLAAATLLLDAGKGVAAVLVVGSLIEHMGGWAGIGAVAGHCFSPWLRFNGGKGVATAAGVIGVLSWPILLVCLAVWAIVISTIRISSVASMVTVIAAPIAAWALGTYWVFLCSVICAIVLVQHRANIGRLLRGEEPKVGSKS